MEAVRVCAVLFNNFTYDSRVLKECRSLAAEGYDVTLLALHDPGLPVEESKDGFRVVRIPIASRRLSWPSRRIWALAKLLEVWFRFLFALLRVRPDVVHCHELLPLLVCIPGARLARARLVYDAHELYTERAGLKGLRKRIFEWIEARGLRRADAVIMSDGESRANVLRRKYRSCPAIDMVHNCPQRPQTAHADRMKLRQQLGLPVDGFLILYIGSVQAYRGLEQALEAMAKLPGAYLVIMGTLNSLGQALQRKARDLGCQDRLLYIGPFPPDQVSYYAQACDVGVCLVQNISLSYLYSLPTKLFEYMAAGIPVLASDFPEIRTAILAAPACGRVVDPSDAAAAVMELSWLRDHKLEAMELGSAGRSKVDQHFNWEHQHKALANIYSRMLSS